MRQDISGGDFTSRPALRDASPTVVLCVILASGAAFGTAAQAALQHLGLDFSSIHNDLIAGHAARARFAVAWWSWCMAVAAAFFVGPLSAALTRAIVANWWRMRALRLGVTAAAVLALAAIGQLRPAPSTFAVTTTAALDLLVVAASTLLAALGARVLGSIGPNAAPAGMRLPVSAPLAAASPWRGGGSAVAGLPFLRFRARHPLAPGPFSFGRLALVAVLACLVLAAVSALGGATVLLDALAPAALRHLLAARLPPAEAGSQARTLVLAMLPVEPRTRVIMPPVALLDLPPPKPIEPPEPRQRAITASVGFYGPVLAESELTFTKGYSRRRAAQLVANMTSLPSIPQLTAAINIKKIRAASLRFTQERRLNRTSADNRYTVDYRRFADSNRSRASRQARAHNRYVDRQARYAEYNSYDRTYDRRGYRDRRHARDGYYGDSHFARAESYRRF